MTTVTAPSPLTAGEKGRAGDKFFSGLTFAAGALILVVLLFVTLFLVVNAYPALVASPAELTGESFFSYVWPLVLGTLLAAGLALLFATPVAIGVALFISHVAPRKLAKPVGYVIDLLAAIPSVVYGAWGMLFLAPLLVPIYDWLHTYLGWIPLFGDPSATGRTILTASIVLAVMVLPIITALSREIFVQTPKLHEEAALALGATRWEMIKMAVLPFARPGVISAIMLGLGRALGETMAVALVLSSGALGWNLLSEGNNTIPAEIAANFPEASGLRYNELIAAGLALFVITLVVNLAARWIVNRHKEFSGAN
ncbi:phosphate ABC transporter permease subunit PstC [Galactobacter valiniphilus]|uniref:Phosphate transport system permease protein n=1 Tax=Galactobacter valiniphilus TaxID=2676122 RepID=A0A399JCQ0_9MICC|nr:phosphate ABC transporter permease subunit PstC [Galactobacter valiniphilus]RII43323.1 phosphate ABC transporter permease subunit PstC [Galactobacter valiniphilus]